MANPTPTQIQLEILKVLKDGKIHTKDEVVETLAKKFKIKITSTVGRKDKFAHSVINQISVLRTDEWLKNPPQKERFAITTAGKAVSDSAIL